MRYLQLIILITILGCNASAPGTTRPNPEWSLTPFEKVDSLNPILLADTNSVFHCPVRNQPIQWEAKDVFNPAAVVRNDTAFLLYRAEDKIGKYAGTSRIGIAWSRDGLNFTKYPYPVLYPEKDSFDIYEWEGGCEDPRIVEDEQGIYYMTYTSYDGQTARLMVASSPDLFHWKKTGPAFAKAENGKFMQLWSKSGAIICRYQQGKAVAVKINGKYWMYWGDTNIFLAASNDLINWTPVENGGGGILPVFGPRKGMFDSDLVEPGPPAMLTDKGILLIYNSRNVRARGDSSLPEGTYTVSQILLDPQQPSKVISRMDHYFIKPDQPYELNGQVNNVCFAEGLIYYKNRWILYYGTADAKIAAAIQ
ncbi:MAG: family 43 glycosylhydrolase [Terrimonas sp.]|nr:family 43 glycosylhydrolase [Terrimonas sp.]